MNKAMLIDKVATVLGVVKKDAKSVVETLFDIMADAAYDGEDISISGFGTFKVVERKERQGHNPKTGEKMLIPARKALKFSASKSLKDKLNEK